MTRYNLQYLMDIAREDRDIAMFIAAANVGPIALAYDVQGNSAGSMYHDGRGNYEIRVEHDENRYIMLATVVHELGHILTGRFAKDEGVAVPHQVNEMVAEVIAWHVVHTSGDIDIDSDSDDLDRAYASDMCMRSMESVYPYDEGAILALRNRCRAAGATHLDSLLTFVVDVYAQLPKRDSPDDASPYVKW